jgi:hypothetical protein
MLMPMFASLVYRVACVSKTQLCQLRAVANTRQSNELLFFCIFFFYWFTRVSGWASDWAKMGIGIKLGHTYHSSKAFVVYSGGWGNQNNRAGGVICGIKDYSRQFYDSQLRFFSFFRVGSCFVIFSFLSKSRGEDGVLSSFAIWV